jgi:hypothetical protein
MANFKIRYLLNNEPITESVEGSGPISALDHFHKSIQLKSGFNPEDYKIVSLALVYAVDPFGSARQGYAESRFDLPHSTNPNLKAPVQPSTLTTSMGFMDEPLEGKLSE